MLDLHSPLLHFQSTHSLDQRPGKPWESIKDSRVSREPAVAMEVTLVEDFSSTSGRGHLGVGGRRYTASRLHTGATVGAMDNASWGAVGERTV